MKKANHHAISNQEGKSIMSDIEWTDSTWNPTKGCSKVSHGCTNCYAVRMAFRLEAMGQKPYQGLTKKARGRIQWTGKISLDEKSLALPLSWKKTRRIFVNSMSDLFHEDIDLDFLKKVWDVMGEAHWHQFQILTKRPEIMYERLSDTNTFPELPNVWLGVSVENRETMHRIEPLRETPASVRFLSLEPLLGPLHNLILKNIDWVIVGGESGPRARPMKEAWIDGILESCQDTETAFFFKQWGGVNKKKTGRLYRNRTWDAYPQDDLGL